MRASRALLLALAAAGLLGACHVETQGAACTADTHCPSGQRCGHDRTCSQAAAACAGPICAASECDGATLRRCVPDAQGVCASLEEVTCSANQACHAGTSSCDCLPSGCGAGVDGFCAPTGERVTCATEAATGCTYAAATEPCPDQQECRPSGLTDATCECQPSSGCPGAGAFCADGQHLVTCAQTNGCWHATAAVACGPGQACGGEHPLATCACPADGAGLGQGCGPAEGATSCAGDTQLACALAAPASACLTWQVAQVCTTGGLVCSGGACGCPPSACAGPGSFCDGSGREVSCLQDAASGCWAEGPAQACAAGEACVGQAPAGACACPASGASAGQGCGAVGDTTCAGDLLLSCAPVTAGSECNVWTPSRDCGATGLVCGGAGAAACACPASICTGPGSYCDGSGREVTCLQDALNGCWTGGAPVACALGETCGGSFPSGACACPADGPAVGQGCATPDALSCAATDLQRCAPAVAGSSCLTWSLEEACAASGLECSAGASPACTCPPPGGPPTVHHADPTAPRRPGLLPTGAEPPLCRHLTLTAALAAAASGDTVKATGFAGAPVVFTEGAITVPAGVALTTAEATPNPARYVLEPAAGVGSATFLSLRPGASITGLQVRNVAATGVGLATACAGAGDAALVTVDTVVISGLGTGAPPARFANGLRHSGSCSLIVRGSTVEGADDTGVVISSPAATTSLTMTGNLIQRNQANVTRYTIGPAPDRSGGGLVFLGSVPGVVTFSANRLLSNAGDQVLVFSAGTVDLSTPACDASANLLACYPSGVAISSKAGTVNVAHTTWGATIPAAGVDFVLEGGAVLLGATQACTPAFVGPCP